MIVNILLTYGSGANKLRPRDRNVYQCDVVTAIYQRLMLIHQDLRNLEEEQVSSLDELILGK